MADDKKQNPGCFLWFLKFLALFFLAYFPWIWGWSRTTEIIVAVIWYPIFAFMILGMINDRMKKRQRPTTS